MGLNHVNISDIFRIAWVGKHEHFKEMTFPWVQPFAFFNKISSDTAFHHQFHHLKKILPSQKFWHFHFLFYFCSMTHNSSIWLSLNQWTGWKPKNCLAQKSFEWIGRFLYIWELFISFLSLFNLKSLLWCNYMMIP